MPLRHRDAHSARAPPPHALCTQILKFWPFVEGLHYREIVLTKKLIFFVFFSEKNQFMCRDFSFLGHVRVFTLSGGKKITNF